MFKLCKKDFAKKISKLDYSIYIDYISNYKIYPVILGDNFDCMEDCEKYIVDNDLYCTSIISLINGKYRILGYSFDGVNFDNCLITDNGRKDIFLPKGLPELSVIDKLKYELPNDIRIFDEWRNPQSMSRDFNYDQIRHLDLAIQFDILKYIHRFDFRFSAIKMFDWDHYMSGVNFPFGNYSIGRKYYD